MGHITSPPSIGSTSGIKLLGDLWSLLKKDIDQVNLFWSSWIFWDTKVHSMAHPEYNIIVTEMLFSEAAVGPHRSWQNNQKKSTRNDNTYSSQGQN